MAILNCWFISQFFGAVTLFSLADKFGRLGRMCFFAITNSLLSGAFKFSVVGMGIGNALQFIASFTGLPELFFCGRFLAGVMSPLCDTCMVCNFV
jgi:MFS family permease